MAVDGLALLEVQAVGDGMIVGVPFIHIRMSSSQVSRDETEVGIMIIQTDCDSAFVSRHSSQASLNGS